MIRKATPSPERPLPPRPASGGTFVFDAEAWAYVQTHAPQVTASMLTAQPRAAISDEPALAAPLKEV